MNPKSLAPVIPRGTVADMLANKGAAVHAIAPSETVYEAIRRMTELRVGALLVMEGQKLTGMISERDYTRKVILKGRASSDTRVDEIMSSPVITVGTKATLRECMVLTSEHQIRHLPVVDGTTVVGVLSINDLVRTIVAQQAETIDSLNSYISGDYPG